MAQNTTHVPDRGATTQHQPRFTDSDIEEARNALPLAFAHLGLVSDGRWQCPACGTAKNGKVIVRQNGSWYCHRCSTGSADGHAITFLTERAHMSFVEAVSYLLGRAPATSKNSNVVAVDIPKAVPAFNAVVDTEVFHAVRDGGSVMWAQRFYERWHIHPEAVTEAGCVILDDPAALQRSLRKNFGDERLIACGLMAVSEDSGRPYFLFGKRYPVVEPHRLPNGDWVGMQFRGSRATEAIVRSYPADKQLWEERKAAFDSDPATNVDPGRKPDYQPKFLSLKGGVVGEHLIGMGLPAISANGTRKKVYVVEGMKDLLAMRTLSLLTDTADFHAYAIPGAGHLPPEVAMNVFKASEVQLIACADGDDAGRAASERLQKFFETNELPNGIKAIPDGMDVADILVQRYVDDGCKCVLAKRVAPPP